VEDFVPVPDRVPVIVPDEVCDDVSDPVLDGVSSPVGVPDPDCVVLGVVLVVFV